LSLNYQMALIYSKWPWIIQTFFIPRPSKNYPNSDFWFEKIPSDNPAIGCWFTFGIFWNLTKQSRFFGNFFPRYKLYVF
jgi:hypothetical protein